jgi:hypothetical protein
VTTDVQLPEAFGDLLKPSRYKCFYGGRGSGKSHSFAKALLLRGGQQRLRILCGRETQKSIKDSVKLLLDTQIEELGMGKFYQSIQTEIRGANGSVFLFAGLSEHTVDTIKSYENIDIFWGEESQSISASSLEIIIPTIRKPGSELWFSWNPRHQSDPVDRRFRGLNLPDDAIIHRVNHDSNPFFPAELEAERLYDYTNIPDRYDHIWKGGYEPQAIGAIWNRQTIHDGRVAEAPVLSRVVVAVDPAISSTDASNEHGIVVAGVGDDDRELYVLEDVTTKGGPEKWARQAIAAYDAWEADAIVIEINQGGDMVRHTLDAVRPGLPIIEVRATRGKHVRAEPVAALYALGRAHHAGSFPELEAQMCLITAAGFDGEGSPDRVDALVWAATELFPSVTRAKAKRKSHNTEAQMGWMGG